MIDRKTVVERNNPHYKCINKKAPLSVGNGTFCFTSDFTGLQTFFNEYSEGEDAFPLCTMAEWGWHSYPFPPDEKEKLRLTPFDTFGRTVCYATDDCGQEELFKRIRVNAHKFHLGKIGFEYSEKTLSFDICKPVSQVLSLWEGILFSEFEIEGNAVKTETFIHPDNDTLHARITSPLLKDTKLRLRIEFPYASHKKNGADFQAKSSHKSSSRDTESKSIKRELDDSIYFVKIDGKGFNIFFDKERHIVDLIPQNESIELCVRFEQQESGSQIDSFNEAKTKCKTFWADFWSSGGFMDFTFSADPRAEEMERRIILSQYLIAIQSRGKLPPAETGLTCNSWYGKFHLEMHFWHHAHFALWGRTEELKRTMEYYKKILPAAKKIASSQGYQGARWPKMCDSSGENTPSSVAVLLLWQQVHPIMFAELVRRAEKNEEFLRGYREIIFETCEFMKSFLHWDGNRYVLGPPYIPVQERHDPKKVLNAAFELEYFRWGFRKADELLKLLGEKERYGEIADKLSLPAEKDGVYLAHENCPDTFTSLPFYTDHPSMLMMYGVLYSEKIDPKIMSATLDKVLSVWDKKTFYGWDFSMMAMTACRLGRYKTAVDLLLMDSPKNTYMENGHNRQEGDAALPLYLPGNGGLLLAAAMMAKNFPGGFNVKTEGLIEYI